MRYVAWDQQMQEEDEEAAVLFLQQFWRFRHRPRPVTLQMIAMGYPVFTGLALQEVHVKGTNWQVLDWPRAPATAPGIAASAGTHRKNRGGFRFGNGFV
jgi:hypothetical protein